LPLSLVLLDVDHFKSYNDAFGHPAGDDVLRAVGALLRRGVRNCDITARYGGEEFAVLLPGAGADKAVEIADRLRGLVAGHDWPSRPVTASFGVATLDPLAPPSGPDELVEQADRALYSSKRLGRNCVTHHNAPSPAVVVG
jgi:diguanylate cyclase (GGDEF)-like protein